MSESTTPAEDLDSPPDSLPSPITRRVLIVEDDQHLVHNLSRLLQQAGFEVLAERRGVAGLETALRTDPDLILMDLDLPGMRPTKLLHDLKQQAPHIPVVAMTGDADSAAPPQVHGCVAVPCSGQSLVNEVRRALGEI